MTKVAINVCKSLADCMFPDRAAAHLLAAAGARSEKQQLKPAAPVQPQKQTSEPERQLSKKVGRAG